MSEILLSILIPTVVGREGQFDRLVKSLYIINGGEFWCNGLGINEGIEVYSLLSCPTGKDEYGLNEGHQIELIALKDDKIITIGEKREKLYAQATGLYSIQIDDDDELAPEALHRIREAIKSNPEVDCITFEEYIDIDGKIEKSNHSLTYGDWEGEGGKELWDGFHYHRTPFFKSVIKTNIAQSIPIPRIRFGEDHQWAQLLKPHLKTEIHIPQQLYRYIHISTPHNERYGFDKQ